MEIVSDIIDENGKRHLVVKYTEEEKAQIKAKSIEHKTYKKQ